MDSNEPINIETENLNLMEDSLSSTVGKKRHRNTHSEVWEYFQKNETILGQTPTWFCKGCKKTYFWGEKHGTSNMRKHIPKCSSITGKTVMFNETEKFDQQKFRDLVTKAVIRHNLPFMFVQYDGIREMLSYLNNKVEHFSRNTARSDVIKVYEKEKLTLKHFIKSCLGKVSLTSDLWTSINTDGFISLTAHFIDNDWTLQKKLLSFSLMPPPHSGAAIFGKVSSLLIEWDIEEKVFACTLDNASSNDKFVELLESHLTFKNALVGNGEFLHVRCVAHILNLMVQDGLKCISPFLTNIRESIKYIKGSQSRKKVFVECIADLSMDRSKKILQQDVPTRWNSTFLMLKSAIHFQHALCRLEVVDRSYTYCPTPDEWVKAKKILDFLEVFYKVTCLFSGSNYPTSNLFFPKIVTVLFTLQNRMKDNDFMSPMAKEMYKKFDKYWRKFSVLLSIACIFDPRHKVEFVRYCYEKVYGVGCYEFHEVESRLEKLYNEYSNKMEKEMVNEASGSKNVESVDVEIGPYSQECEDMLEEFYSYRNNDLVVSSRKSELKSYLEDGLLAPKASFDILSFWKSQQYKYPILSSMAKDILAVPITTVASESAFSVGGRVLDDYRSSLKADIVEALLCSRDWLYGNDTISFVEQPDEDISVLHLDEESAI